MPLSAEVSIVEERDSFLVTRDRGFIWRTHLAPLDSPAKDFVAVAETLIGVPYLWGGKSGIGIDCSGLVQISLAAAGRNAPRDSDMQEATLGEPVEIGAPLQRGDMIFWKGHVGVMRDPIRCFMRTGRICWCRANRWRWCVRATSKRGRGTSPGVRRLMEDNEP